MDNFKRCHIIKTDITLQSKVENDHLFVFYKDQWVQLSKKNNPDRFYSNQTLRKRYGSNLCNELGMYNPNKYSRELYLKNQESRKKAGKKASKKYYHKKKAEKSLS